MRRWIGVGLLVLGLATPVMAAEETCESALRASRLELDYYARSKAQDLTNAIKVIADQQVIIDRLKADLKARTPDAEKKAPAP